jgi:hypothetical protein
VGADQRSRVGGIVYYGAMSLCALMLTSVYAGLVVLGSFGTALRVLTTFAIVVIFVCVAWFWFMLVLDAEDGIDDLQDMKRVAVESVVFLIESLAAGLCVGIWFAH